MEFPPPLLHRFVLQLTSGTMYIDTHRAGTHARTQGIVKGTLSTEPNLPSHLRQSMFAEEREWPVLCRYSSEPGDPGLDVRSYLLQHKAWYANQGG